MTEAKFLKLILKRSLIGVKPTTKAHLKGLGLGKVNQVKLIKDTRENRGLINKVIQFIEVKSDVNVK